MFLGSLVWVSYRNKNSLNTEKEIVKRKSSGMSFRAMHTGPNNGLPPRPLRPRPLFTPKMRFAFLPLFLCFVTSINALHFYLDANQQRCFIEELPTDTVVEGERQTLINESLYLP
jgi:hypothetical protein